MAATDPDAAPAGVDAEVQIGQKTAPLLALATLASLLISGCGAAPSADPASSTQAVPFPLFLERADELGLDYRHENGENGQLFFNEVVGPGVALFDADLDGDLDVYVTQGHELPHRIEGVSPSAADTDRLYRNELVCTPEGCAADSLAFTDVTATSGLEAAGYGMGVAVGDANADGLPDLYVTNFGPNELWLNRGNLRFELAHRDPPRQPPVWSSSAAFFDADGDGDHDLYEVNYVVYDPESSPGCADQRTGRPDYCGPQGFPAEPDRLLLQTDGILRDASAEWSVSAAQGKGLGVVEFDADGDGRSDLFIANDLMENLLWIQTDEGFEERAGLAGLATNSLGRVEASMGIAVGDVDGDGREDLLSAHLEGETNTLYRNLGDGVFLDFSQASRLGAPSMAYTAFGATFADFDLDGHLDAALANGAVTIYNDQTRPAEARALEQSNQLFFGVGEGRFEEANADRLGAAFFEPHVGRGLATGDLDNDGDMDLVFTNNGGPLQVLINQLQQSLPTPWIGLDVRDDHGSAALGATVRPEPPKSGPVHRVRRTDSYLSSRDPRILLPAAVGPVEIRWPDGTTRRLAEPAVGRYTRVDRTGN